MEQSDSEQNCALTGVVFENKSKWTNKQTDTALMGEIPEESCMEAFLSMDS